MKPEIRGPYANDGAVPPKSEAMCLKLLGVRHEIGPRPLSAGPNLSKSQGLAFISERDICTLNWGE